MLRKNLTTITTMVLMIAVVAAAVLLYGTSAAYAAGTEKTTEEILADNGLPVVYINIGDEEFEKVNESDDHSYKCESGTVTVTVPEGYKGDYSEDVLDDSGLKNLEIEYFRGRGNSTWSTDKKPYKLKLKEKTDLLGMGADKTWALLANRYDVTMLHNRIALYMANSLGLKYTPKGLPVDLVVNGKYHGSYFLAQDVKIGETRVAIDELEKNHTTAPKVTGGYLLAMWPYYKEAPENVFATERGLRFGMEEPQFDPEFDEETQQWKEQAPKEQRDYIIDYMQKTEDAIFGEDLKDQDGVPYTDYMDTDSAARYWWVEIFCKNSDALTSPSTYLYKERDKTDEARNVTEKGKLYWGPLWDMDLSMEEFGGPEQVLDDDDGFNFQYLEWLDYLRAHDPSYRAKLIQCWNELDAVIGDILKDGGVLEKMVQEQRNSYIDDFDRWGLENETGIYSKYSTGEEVYDAATEDLWIWLTLRKRWMKKHVSDDALADIYAEVTLKDESGAVIDTVEVVKKIGFMPYPAAPEKKGYVFTTWKREDTGKTVGRYDDINENMTLVPVYVKESDVKKKAKTIAFEVYDPWAELSSKVFEPSLTVDPYDFNGFTVRWYSSDPEVAEVDEYGEGIVRLKKTGKTTITAKVLSGKTFSYVLTVYDAMETHSREPEYIKAGTSTINLKVGQTACIRWLIGPQPCKIDYDCESSNDKVVEDISRSMIKAISAGKATLEAFIQNNESISAKVTVIVTKYANTLKAKAKSKAVKVRAKTLKKKTVRITRKKAVKVTGAVGKVSYKRVKITCKKKLKKAAKKKIKVNAKTGKITLKKGLKKGVYKVKIRVRAAGNAKYKAAAKNVSVKIVVK